MKQRRYDCDFEYGKCLVCRLKTWLFEGAFCVPCLLLLHLVGVV